MRKFIYSYLILLIIISPSEAQIKRDTVKESHGSYEIRAAFPGGDKNWKNYLRQNFRENEVECEMPIRDTTYIETAVVQFKILKDGKIAEVLCRNSNLINSALKNEAVRLITEAPLWIPAERNERLMNDYRIEKISISVPLVSLNNEN